MFSEVKIVDMHDDNYSAKDGRVYAICKEVCVVRVRVCTEEMCWKMSNGNDGEGR